MRLLALVLVPLVAAAAAYAHRSAGLRNGWLLGAAAFHLVLVGSLWARPEPPVFGEWLALDALGLVVLTVVTVLFAVRYLPAGSARWPDPALAGIVAGAIAFGAVMIVRRPSPEIR